MAWIFRLVKYYFIYPEQCIIKNHKTLPQNGDV